MKQHLFFFSCLCVAVLCFGFTPYSGDNDPIFKDDQVVENWTVTRIYGYQFDSSGNKTSVSKDLPAGDWVFKFEADGKAASWEEIAKSWIYFDWSLKNGNQLVLQYSAENADVYKILNLHDSDCVIEQSGKDERNRDFRIKLILKKYTPGDRLNDRTVYTKS